MKNKRLLLSIQPTSPLAPLLVYSVFFFFNLVPRIFPRNKSGLSGPFCPRRGAASINKVKHVAPPPGVAATGFISPSASSAASCYSRVKCSYNYCVAWIAAKLSGNARPGLTHLPPPLKGAESIRVPVPWEKRSPSTTYSQCR